MAAAPPRLSGALTPARTARATALPPHLEALAATLRAAPYLPPDWHRGAGHLALAASATDLLVALAKRPDAPQDALAAYAASGGAVVHEALMARSDGAGHALLPQRTPVTHAATLARQLAPGAAPYVIADAIAAFTAKPTTTVARALTMFPAHLPAPVAAAILARLDAAGQGLLLTPLSLMPVVARAGRPAAAELLATVSAPALVASLAAFDLPDALIQSALVRAGAGVRTELLWPRIRVGWLADAVISTKTPAVTAQLLGALEAALGPHAAELAAFANIARIPTPRIAAAATWDPAPALPVAGPQGMPAAAAVLAAASGADPAALEGAAAAECAHPTQGGHVLAVLLRNHATPAHVRRAIAAAVPALVRAGQGLPSLEALDVFALPVQDRDINAAWIAAFPGHVLAQHGWAPFGGPAAVGAVLASVAAVPGLAAEHLVRRRAAVAAVARVGVPAHLVPDLLLTDLHDLSACQGLTRAPMREAEAAFVAGALGSGAGAWSMYATLRTEFAGTLRQLTQVALTATAPPA